jgi:hypothetical protein
MMADIVCADFGETISQRQALFRVGDAGKITGMISTEKRQRQ